MKLRYYAGTDCLYIGFKVPPGVETREIVEGIDLDASGVLVGLDIDHASQQLDLTTLETDSPPLRSIKAA